MMSFRLLFKVVPIFCLSLICAEDLKPVDELIIEKYVGRWYQAYGSAFVKETFEKDGVCVTADYGYRLDGNISVYNAMRLLRPNGTPSNISGFAIPSERPGVLQVQLQGVPFRGNYWVYKLGPQSFGPDDLYEYAVVSEPTGLNLFVLTRDIKTFKEKYDVEVRKFLDENGFNNTLNPYIETFHDENCLYPKSSEIIPVDELELERYYGRWYQPYASRFVALGIQRGGFCSTATYAPLPGRNISVFNAMRLFAPDGPPSSIFGVAYPTNRVGVLKVKLEGGSPRPGNYWVVKLGPKTFGPDGYYEYAVVSEPRRLSLFVLVRDVKRFNELFEEDVKRFLEEEGFNTEDNPYEQVYQGDDCIYPA